MDTEEESFELITHLMPVDVTAVRDNGMKALVMLAVSLGWNARHKHNQPMVITARDGVQKRLPTNTSIRMSVFQTALSTIMVHTEPDRIPTIELIDAIITATKPSVDHQRRLRLSVGESPTQHRQRVEAVEAEAKGSREPQPLTTRIDEVLDAHFRQVLEDMPEEPAARAATEEEEMEIQGAFTPADGGEHGEMASREPFQATRNTSGRITTTYTSDISFERRWTDGYIDYECQVCGKAFNTPKGVGSHSQHHDQHEQPAWKRASGITRVVKVPSILEWEEPPEDEELTEAEVEAAIPPQPPDPEDRPVLQSSGWKDDDPTGQVEPTDEPRLTNVDDSFILGQIAALVAPELVRRVAELKSENEFLRDRLEEVEGEFDAFLEMAASRRKKT